MKRCQSLSTLAIPDIYSSRGREMFVDDTLSKGLARRILKETGKRWEILEHQLHRAKKASRTRWYARKLEFTRNLFQDCLLQYTEKKDGKYRIGYVAGILWLPSAVNGVSGVFMVTHIDGRHVRANRKAIALISLHALERVIQTCGDTALPVLARRLQAHLITIGKLHAMQKVPLSGFVLYTQDGMSAWAPSEEGLPVLKTLVAREVLEPRHLKYINSLDNENPFHLKISTKR